MQAIPESMENKMAPHGPHQAMTHQKNPETPASAIIKIDTTVLDFSFSCFLSTPSFRRIIPAAFGQWFLPLLQLYSCGFHPHGFYIHRKSRSHHRCTDSEPHSTILHLLQTHRLFSQWYNPNPFSKIKTAKAITVITHKKIKNQ